MSEKPILFNTDMIQEIRDDRKTQTRRTAKPQPPEETSKIIGPEWYHPTAVKADGEEYPGPLTWGIFSEDGEWGTKCPYQPGDILWVRETWAWDTALDCYVYRADYGGTEDDSFPPSMYKWRPSIHMPRAAARIFLKVADVRAERLREITEEDAIAEGCRAYGPDNCSGTSARIAFFELWDSIYEKRGHGWESNPWVFVVVFERVKNQ